MNAFIPNRALAETGIERRISTRLVAYWESIRKGRALPAEADFDPKALADIWDNCFYVQVLGEVMQEYKYRHLGPHLAEAYSSGLGEKAPGEKAALIAFSGAKLAASYARVIASRKPVLEEDEFTNGRGEVVKYRQCLLPLGHGEIVTAILGGVRFKAFGDKK